MTSAKQVHPLDSTTPRQPTSTIEEKHPVEPIISDDLLDGLFRGYHVQVDEDGKQAKSSLVKRIRVFIRDLFHRCWSITVLLPTVLVVQILLTAAVVFAMTYVNSLKSVNDLSSQLVRELNGNVNNRVEQLLGIPAVICSIMQKESSLHHIFVTDHPQSGNFTQEKYETSALYTLSLLHSFPSAALIYFGNRQGDIVGFEQNNGKYYRWDRFTYGKLIPVTENTTLDDFCVLSQGHYNLTVHPAYSNGTLIPGTDPTTNSCGFDCRLRPWFIGSVAHPGENRFSLPYMFPDAAVGISISKSVYSSFDDAFLGVVSVDFKLSTLNDFLKQLKVGKTGRAFLMTKAGEFLASNKLQVSSQEERVAAGMSPVESISDRFISDSAKEITRRYGGYTSVFTAGASDSEQFEANIADESCFVYISNLDYADNVSWLVVVVLPKSDFLSNIYTSNIITISTTCVFVLLSIAVALLITSLIIFPLFNLGRKMKNAANMQLMEKKTVLPVLYEVHQIQNRFSSLLRALRFFKKFIPSTVIRRVMLEDEHSASRVTEAEDMSMLFADIEGFSTFAESLSPNDLLEVMSIAMESMSQLVLQNGGLVDAFVGDAIIALYGIPGINDDDQHALHAVLTGMQCVRRMKELDEAWKSFGLKPLRIRVGINSGRCIVGMLGSRQKISFSALGSPMNLAARLEPLNKEYGSRILISEVTQRKVKDKIVCRVVDRVIAKGFSSPTNVYEPICERDSATADELQVERVSQQIFESLQDEEYEECFRLIDMGMKCAGFENDPVLETIRGKVADVRDGKRSLVTKMTTK